MTHPHLARPIHTAPPAQERPSNLPTVVPFNEDKYEPPSGPEPRYNLCSCQHVVLSAIELLGEANARGIVVNTVIDEETRDSLEYHHLIQHPKTNRFGPGARQMSLVD
jgi:hypothetical protein